MIQDDQEKMKMDTKRLTIIELEKSRKERKIDDWRIALVRVRHANQYMTKNFEKESFLTSEKQELHVTIYKKIGKKIGDSSFVVTDAPSQAIRNSINEAIGLCEYAKKEPYTIPNKRFKKSGTLLADKAILSGFETGKIHKQIDQTCEKAMKEVKKKKNIKLNGLELHVSSTLKQVINSRGVSQEQEKTFVYMEIALTAFDKKREMEFFPSRTVSRLSDLKIKTFVDENAQFALDVLNSKPAKDFRGPVIISKDAVDEFFVPEQSLNPLFVHCSARIKYMSLSRYHKGKPIAAHFKGDKMTAGTNPFIDYNPGSSDFDEDGVQSKKVNLIKEGVCTNYFGSKRFCDYLKIEATGSTGSMEICSGKTPEKQIYSAHKGKGVFEIVSFSSFTPNAVSGDFSAEIRLGYLWKDGKKVPFKGGMFTGNIFKLVEDMRLSRERKTAEGYSGPKAARFENATIAGL